MLRTYTHVRNIYMMSTDYGHASFFSFPLNRWWGTDKIKGLLFNVAHTVAYFNHCENFQDLNFPTKKVVSGKWVIGCFIIWWTVLGPKCLNQYYNLSNDSQLVLCPRHAQKSQFGDWQSSPILPLMLFSGCYAAFLYKSHPVTP